MILLDTNVVSEPLKASGDMSVQAWIDAQIIETLSDLEPVGRSSAIWRLFKATA